MDTSTIKNETDNDEHIFRRNSCFGTCLCCLNNFFLCIQLFVCCPCKLVYKNQKRLHPNLSDKGGDRDKDSAKILSQAIKLKSSSSQNSTSSKSGAPDLAFFVDETNILKTKKKEFHVEEHEEDTSNNHNIVNSITLQSSHDHESHESNKDMSEEKFEIDDISSNNHENNTITIQKRPKSSRGYGSGNGIDVDKISSSPEKIYGNGTNASVDRFDVDLDESCVDNEMGRGGNHRPPARSKQIMNQWPTAQRISRKIENDDIDENENNETIDDYAAGHSSMSMIHSKGSKDSLLHSQSAGSLELNSNPYSDVNLNVNSNSNNQVDEFVWTENDDESRQIDGPTNQYSRISSPLASGENVFHDDAFRDDDVTSSREHLALTLLTESLPMSEARTELDSDSDASGAIDELRSNSERAREESDNNSDIDHSPAAIVRFVSPAREITVTPMGDVRESSSEGNSREESSAARIFKDHLSRQGSSTSSTDNGSSTHQSSTVRKRNRKAKKKLASQSDSESERLRQMASHLDIPIKGPPINKELHKLQLPAVQPPLVKPLAPIDWKDGKLTSSKLSSRDRDVDSSDYRPKASFDSASSLDKIGSETDAVVCLPHPNKLNMESGRSETASAPVTAVTTASISWATDIPKASSSIAITATSSSQQSLQLSSSSSSSLVSSKSVAIVDSLTSDVEPFEQEEEEEEGYKTTLFKSVSGIKSIATGRREVVPTTQVKESQKVSQCMNFDDEIRGFGKDDDELSCSVDEFDFDQKTGRHIWWGRTVTKVFETDLAAFIGEVPSDNEPEFNNGEDINRSPRVQVIVGDDDDVVNQDVEVVNNTALNKAIGKLYLLKVK